MWSKKQLTKRKKHQKGFSTLEVLVGTVLIGTLVAGGIYYANIGEKQERVEQTNLEVFSVVRMPEALLTAFLQNNRTLVSVTATNLTGTGSVRENQPVEWSVGTTAAQRITINITLTDNDEATAFATLLNANSGNTMVDTVTVASESAVAAVEYEL